MSSAFPNAGGAVKDTQGSCGAVGEMVKSSNACCTEPGAKGREERRAKRAKCEVRASGLSDVYLAFLPLLVESRTRGRGRGGLEDVCYAAIP